MEFKQFIINNWEYFAGLLGLGTAGVGGQKAYKAIQKQKDKGQDSRIKTNTSDIMTLKREMIEVKAELKRNTQADIEFRQEVRDTMKDTNTTLKELSKQFTDFIQKDFIELIKDVYRGK